MYIEMFYLFVSKFSTDIRNKYAAYQTNYIYYKAQSFAMYDGGVIELLVLSHSFLLEIRFLIGTCVKLET